MSKDERGPEGKRRLTEGIEIIIGEAKSAATQAFSGAESLGDSLKETLQGGSPIDGRIRKIMKHICKAPADS